MQKVVKSNWLLILLLLAVPALAQDIAFDTLSVNMNQQHYNLQIADNNQRRSLGLMHRNSLPPEEGMLFVYPKLGNYRIWMKNTLIPLTVMWLDEQAQIVEIKLLLPCKQAPCQIYSAARPARYIIELDQSQYHLYKKGDQFPELKAVLSNLSSFM
jgi:uncharacterized protein